MHILDLGSARTGSSLFIIHFTIYNSSLSSASEFLISTQAGRLKVSGGFEETMGKKKRYLIDQGGHFEDF